MGSGEAFNCGMCWLLLNMPYVLGKFWIWAGVVFHIRGVSIRGKGLCIYVCSSFASCSCIYTFVHIYKHMCVSFLLL